MNSCPCCSAPLLRHIRGHQVHWFCRTCWQDMPVLSLEKSATLSEVVREKFPNILPRKEKLNAPIGTNKREGLTRWIDVQNFSDVLSQTV